MINSVNLKIAGWIDNDLAAGEYCDKALEAVLTIH